MLPALELPLWLDRSRGATPMQAKWIELDLISHYFTMYRRTVCHANQTNVVSICPFCHKDGGVFEVQDIKASIYAHLCWFISISFVYVYIFDFNPYFSPQRVAKMHTWTQWWNATMTRSSWHIQLISHTQATSLKYQVYRQATSMVSLLLPRRTLISTREYPF